MEIIEITVAFFAAVGIMSLLRSVYYYLEKYGYQISEIYIPDKNGLYAEKPDAVIITESNNIKYITDAFEKEFGKIYIEKGSTEWIIK